MQAPGPHFEYLARWPRPVDHTSCRTGHSRAGRGLVAEQTTVVVVWPGGRDPPLQEVLLCPAPQGYKVDARSRGCGSWLSARDLESPGEGAPGRVWPEPGVPCVPAGRLASAGGLTAIHGPPCPLCLSPWGALSAFSAAEVCPAGASPLFFPCHQPGSHAWGTWCPVAWQVGWEGWLDRS